MARHKPNPNRFEEFEEFNDKSGFSIYENGRDIDFYYDKFNGWFDEHGSYYGSNGQPARPNRESLQFWDTIRQRYQSNDDIDDLLNEYDQNDDSDDNQDVDYEREFQIKEQIVNLTKRIRHYPDNQEIKIYFKGANWRTSLDNIKDAFGAQYIKRVEMDQSSKYSQGKGLIIAVNKAAAAEIAKQHRKEVQGYPIYLEVERLNLLDSDDEHIGHPPLTQQPQSHQQSHQQHQQKQVILSRAAPLAQPIQQPVQQLQPQQQQPQPQQQPQQQKLINSQVSHQQNTEQHTQSKQVKQPQSQVETYSIVISNIPKSETQQQFISWLSGKVNVSWDKVAWKADDKESRIKLDFKNQDLSNDFYHKIVDQLSFKGKCKLKLMKLNN